MSKGSKITIYVIVIILLLAGVHSFVGDSSEKMNDDVVSTSSPYRMAVPVSETSGEQKTSVAGSIKSDDSSDSAIFNQVSSVDSQMNDLNNDNKNTDQAMSKN